MTTERSPPDHWAHRLEHYAFSRAVDDAPALGPQAIALMRTGSDNLRRRIELPIWQLQLPFVVSSDQGLAI
jgi:hypothetical protein